MARKFFSGSNDGFVAVERSLVAKAMAGSPVMMGHPHPEGSSPFPLRQSI